jgi:hypothetical protein
MLLREDQELRRDLALRVLDRCTEPRRTLEIAARLERYVMQGRQTPGQNQEPKPSIVAAPASPDDSPKSHCQRRWTRGEDRQLGQLWQESAGVLAIARVLDRTPEGVNRRVRRQGLDRDNGRGSTPIRNSEPKIPLRKSIVTVPSNTADQEQVSISSVIWFLRTRDYTVVQTVDGCYRLDGRDVLTAEELFKRANRVRECLGRPTWTRMLGTLN